MSLTSVALFRSLTTAVLAGTSLAQVQTTWSTIAGGSPALPDIGYASAVDGAGATFLAGTRDVDPGSSASYRAVVTKVGRDGAVEWTRTYVGPVGGTQGFAHVGVDAVGNVTVAGVTPANDATTVARYDTSGNLLWLHVLTGPSGGPFGAEAMRVTPTGDVVLAGYAAPPWSPTSDGLVTRIHPDGTTAWTHVFVGSSGWNDSATDVVLDAAGNAYATGQTGKLWLNGYFAFGTFALKLAFDGSPVWSTEILPSLVESHQDHRAAVDAQGRLYVADTILLNNGQFLDLIQFDANGAHVWDRQVLSETYARVAGMIVRADGSLLVGASLLASTPAQALALVGAWDPTGALLWSTTYDAPGGQREFATDLDLDPAGGAILTGWHMGSASFNVVFAAHVTDAGQLDWTQILSSASAHETYPKLHVAPDDSLRVHSRLNEPFGGFQTRVRRLEHDVTAFCSGDGSATACPCGNSAAPRSGCASSLGVGAALRGSGSASIAFDSLLLSCTQLPPTTVLFFQGTQRVASGAGAVFGDGLRCAGGAVARLGTRSSQAGSASFPPAGQSLSLLGHVTAPGLRTYQCWYRNSASFCTPDTFNLSNGLTVLWRP